ncbi:MAG: hypothetical protein OXU36_17370 [Candidatus Poribacteria bacterium]|nr:hypothetical protein [Candidatus Poribacteria bacterium]
MRFFFVLASTVLVMLCQLSCSPDDEQTEIENPITGELLTGFNAAPLLGDVVLENMYEDEARKLTDKTPVQIVTVLEGTSRVVLQARFRGVRYLDLGFPLYECELMDESIEAMGGIARGMSGSPVGPPGRIMGALAYGQSFGKAPSRFLVTSIDAMEATIDYQTFGEVLEAVPVPAAPAVGINATYTPVKTPVMISGIQPHTLQELSSHLTDSRYSFVELFAAPGGVLAAPPIGASLKLAAGDMIGTAAVTGDIVNIVGYGTVTQVYDDKFVAFGHPLFADGKSALPVYRAVVNGIIPNLIASYKSVSHYGKPIGRITKDLAPAIVGELGAPPPTIPVKVSYHPANSTTAIEKHHRVAYGQEGFISMVAAGTLGALRMESSNGTVDGTVTLQFQETDIVYTEPFRSASPSAPTDVLIKVDQIVRSFADTLSNSAGKATLKAVSISMTDTPQIAKADISEVIAPEEVMPGESVTVSITLVPHWSTAGAERTIQREVTLEVPEDFPAGEANINVAASAFDLFGGFGDLGALGPPPGAIPDFGFDFDPFGDEEEKPVPTNLDELIKQMEEDQMDPGLITVTLTPPGLGGFPGLPPDFLPPEGLLPPEGFLPPEDGKMPEEGEENGNDDGEIPGDFPLPEGFPGLDALGIPEEVEPPEPVEVELIIDGFIVTGSRDATIIIKGEEMGDGMAPVEGEVHIKPVEEE